MVKPADLKGAFRKPLLALWARIEHGLSWRAARIGQRGRFLQQFRTLKNTPHPRFALDWHDRYPCFDDSTAETSFNQHYVYLVAWACRILAQTKPAAHTDISSSLFFVVGASAFIPFHFYDYRPAPLGLSNLDSHHADLTDLPFPNGSLPSLSCMHVVEHVGLGRYGDPLDYDGDLKAAKELSRVLAPQGQLLFVVPISGAARIYFNAHRQYTYQQVIGMFEGLHLVEFSLITDRESHLGLVRNADETLANRQIDGCGCFWFQKP